MSKNIRDGEYDVDNVLIPTWKMKTRLITNQKNGQIWRLFTSLKKDNQRIISQYIKRFNIEKMFQDQKSSLFQIELTQIKKYSKFKKLYYLVTLTQAIMMLMGYFIEEKLPELKKKYPIHGEILCPLLK